MSRHIEDEEITEIIDEYLEEDGPGVAVLVMEEGEITHCAGHGAAVIGGKAITSTTVFDLASVSKQFTAAAIMLLAAEGKLSVDDPLRRYLPGFTVPAKGREITLRDLLRHTSGLADYSNADFDDATFANLTNDQHLRWLNQQALQRAPGKKYEYNNSNYVLLAHVVEAVSRQYFANFLQQRIFGPLGMAQTASVVDTSLAIPGRAKGYVWDDDEEDWVESESPSKIQGDGNIFSTLEDMAKWCEALRKGTILPKAWLAKMWTNGALDNGEPIDDEGSGYGFGWCTYEEDGIVNHDGSWYGAATYLQINIEAERAYVALSNDEDMDVGALIDEIDELLDSRDEEDE